VNEVVWGRVDEGENDDERGCVEEAEMRSVWAWPGEASKPAERRRVSDDVKPEEGGKIGEGVKLGVGMRVEVRWCIADGAKVGEREKDCVCSIGDEGDTGTLAVNSGVGSNVGVSAATAGVSVGSTMRTTSWRGV
jgi:hypothetical protein